MSDVSLFITSEQTSSERRISPTWTIAQLKERLEHITGIPPSSQHLLIYGPSGTSPVPINDSDDGRALVGQYNPAPYGRIHVEDTRPAAAQVNLNDTSEVEKYVIPETEYSSRKDSVLHWKKTNQLGRFDPLNQNKKEQEGEITKSEIQSRQIDVGKRCKVSPGDRLGTVRYVGVVPEINETCWWAGVEFDEPVGKNDGSVKGKSYFTAKPGFGSFVKPSLVEVGDFPSEFDDDDEL
ncbi:hypothetical protein TRICI_001464 [Trichomonascus ciferrii]|uniref:CAP-Gly domain-containing protein n=1 Tax=Trichomonascus ciferrii TaxID=44093 RepID=A0A642V9L4_9ASCO|nr:hypothetical protein TRICI_001464 [Trichomonascus ciferrii]